MALSFCLFLLLCLCYLQSISSLVYISTFFHLISLKYFYFYRSPCVEKPTVQHSEAPLPSYSLKGFTRARTIQMHPCPRHQNQFPRSHHHRRQPRCRHTLFSSATRTQQPLKRGRSSERKMQRHTMHSESVEMSICALSELILSHEFFLNTDKRLTVMSGNSAISPLHHNPPHHFISST